MAECCSHGICEIKDQIIGNEDAANVMRGLVNKAVKRVKLNPAVGVRDLTKSISESTVTLTDVVGADRELDPIAYYWPERDGEHVPGTELNFSTLAVAVSTCVTRAVDGVCQELTPIPLETIRVRGE